MIIRKPLAGTRSGTRSNQERTSEEVAGWMEEDMKERVSSQPLPEELGVATDEELLELLISAADQHLPEGLPEEIVARGEAMVEPLCEILLREDLWKAEEGTPGLWAPDYALYLLGEIAAPRAAPAIIELLRHDDPGDTLHSIGATVLGRMGPDVVPLIESFVRDRSIDPVIRGAIGGGALVYIGYHHPDLRKGIVELLVSLLGQVDEDPEFIAFLLWRCIYTDDPSVGRAIGEAFERDTVDQGIIALEDVQEELLTLKVPWFDRRRQIDLMAELLSISKPRYVRPGRSGQRGKKMKGKTKMKDKRKQSRKSRKRRRR